MGASNDDAALMERILHRLAMTPDENLAAVLDKLLPKLVEKLNDTEARDATLQVLSHVSKRVRPNNAIGLPCAALLNVCKSVPHTSFAFNFGSVFLELGLPRVPPETRPSLAVGLMQGISRLPRHSAQQNAFLNMLLSCLDAIPMSAKAAAAATGKTIPLQSPGETVAAAANGAALLVADAGEEPLDTADAAEIADFLLDLELFSGGAPGAPAKPAADGATAASAVTEAPGLSGAGLARLTLRQKTWPRPQLTARKLQALRALKSGLFPPAARVPAALAAACDNHHEVIQAAEDLLKSLSAADRGRIVSAGAGGGTISGDAALAGNLMALILGGGGGGSGGGAARPNEARAPASAAVSSRALSWLLVECPAGLAGRIPDAVRVVFHCLVAPNTVLAQDRANFGRMRASGAALAAFVASRAPPELLLLVGPLLLQAVQRVLLADGGGGDGPGEGASLVVQARHGEMLEGCYETIAALAREPAIFARDASVPALLFGDMARREPGLRVKISAALGALKPVYRSAAIAATAAASGISKDHLGSNPGGYSRGHGVSSSSGAEQNLQQEMADPGWTAELWVLLWSAASSEEHRARLCAIDWANDIFPFCHVGARRLCVALSDDPVTAVRGAAARGLEPLAPTPAAVAAGAAERRTAAADVSAVAAEDSAASVDVAAAAMVAYPDPSAFILDVLDENAPRPPGSSRGLLELPPVALARALDFACECTRRAEPGYFEAGSGGSSGDGAARRAVALRALLGRLEAALEAAPSLTDAARGHVPMQRLHRAAAQSLQAVLTDFAPSAAAAYAERGAWLQRWLAHEASTEIREAFAQVAGAVAPAMPEQEHLVPFLRALGLKVRACTSDAGASSSNRAVAAAHGALCALGAVVSALAPKSSSFSSGLSETVVVSESAAARSALWASLLPDVLPRAVSAAASAVGHPVSLLHLAACEALGRIGAAAALPLPSLPPPPLPESVPAVEGTAAAAAAAAAASAAATAAAATAGLPSGVVALQHVFEDLWSCCKLGETSDAGRRCEAAADALGKSCLGIGIGGGEFAETALKSSASRAQQGFVGAIGLQEASRLRLRTLDALFGVSRHLKEEELQFAVAEAARDVARTGYIVLPHDQLLSLQEAMSAAGRQLATCWPVDTGAATGATVADGAVADMAAESTAVTNTEGSAAAVAAAATAMEVEVPAADVMDVDGQAVVAAPGTTVCMDAMELVLCRVLFQLLEDHSPQVSGASAVYLIALTRGSGANNGAAGLEADRVLQMYLGDMQSAFTRLLTARSEFVQEAAGRGLALVYDAAGDAARRGLVDSLVQALSTGQRAKSGPGVDVHGISHAGAALSSAGSSAYADMCAVANDVGRPDLIYSFLSLASHHAAWTTRRGAGYGLAAIFATAAEALRPHAAALVPRLYRYRHDPSARTRQAMQQLWEAVASAAVPAGNGGGTAETVRIHFAAIMEELLRAAGDRRWRERQGSCAALSSLLPGRGWPELGPFLERLWDSCDRALDDVKETVVVAAADFAKALVAASLRLCDPASTSSEAPRGAGGSANPNAVANGAAAATAAAATADAAEARRVRAAEAREAVAVLLPWLLHKGLLSRCKASQALSLQTLQRLVKTVDGPALKPHLAELVATLVEALSALEPAALQYMQFHAESRLDMTQDSMERLRLSLARAGPLQEALDSCYKHLDDGVAEQLMPRLMALLRSGVGLATRSASAFLVLTLCEKTPREVRNASSRLLPTLTNAALAERSVALQSTYSSAVAAVTRLAPHQRAARLVRQLCRLFRELDPALDARQRKTAAALLADVCRRAGNSLCSDSPGAAEWGADGWAGVLPLAFVARRDPEEAVAEAFGGIWTEGMTQLQLGAVATGDFAVRNARDALGIMLPQVVDELAASLANPSRVTRRQACAAAKDIAAIFGDGRVLGGGGSGSGGGSIGGSGGGSSDYGGSGGGYGGLGSRPEARRLLRLLLAMVPGRVWDGKDTLLEAVVAIAAACKDGGVAVSETLTEAGSCSSGVGLDEEDAGRDAKRSKLQSGGGNGGVGADSAAEDDAMLEVEEAEEGERGAAEEEAVSSLVAGEKEGDAAVLDAVVAAEGAYVRAAATASTAELVVPSGVEEDAGGGDKGTDDGGYMYREQITLDGNDRPGSEDIGLAALALDRDIVAAAAMGAPAATPLSAGPPAEAAATLATAAAAVAEISDAPVPYSEIFLLLRRQLRQRGKVFCRAAVDSLAALVAAFPEPTVLPHLLPSLLELARLGEPSKDGDDPVLEAKAVVCLAAAWPHLAEANAIASSGSSSSGTAGIAGEARAAWIAAAYEAQAEHAASLGRAARVAMSRKVWSVRVALLNLLTALAKHTYAPADETGSGDGSDSGGGGGGSTMRLSPLTGTALDDMIAAATAGASDPKYSQVRAAAVAVLAALAARRELRLLLTPHKEEISAIAATAAADTDPGVASVGARLRQALAWWP